MYHCTVDLLFDWFGISCMTTDNFCFYLQNRLIQTSQTGGQSYSDTSSFSIPCLMLLNKAGACYECVPEINFLLANVLAYCAVSSMTKSKRLMKLTPRQFLPLTSFPSSSRLLTLAVSPLSAALLQSTF